MRTEDFARFLAFLFITKEIVADSCTEQHFKEISSKIVSIIHNRLYNIILSVQDIFKYFIYIFVVIYLQHLHKRTKKLEPLCHDKYLSFIMTVLMLKQYRDK